MNRMKLLLASAAALLFLAACRNAPLPTTADWKMPAIHPEVFSMVDCWISDTGNPVATEINLDAVLKNRNQYDMGAVEINGNDVRYNRKSGEGWAGYRVLRSEGRSLLIEFYDNGGGSLTTSTLFNCTLERRTLTINGIKQEVRMLRINGIKGELCPSDCDKEEVGPYFGPFRHESQFDDPDADVPEIHNHTVGTWKNIHKGDPNLLGIRVQQFPDCLPEAPPYEGHHPAMVIYVFKDKRCHQMEFEPDGKIHADHWWQNPPDWLMESLEKPDAGN